jgi:hypothetical protein
MVARKPDHQGEHEAAVKTIARGMPERFGLPVVNYSYAFLLCVRGCGCGWAPRIPCALFLEGFHFNNSGAFAP